MSARLSVEETMERLRKRLTKREARSLTSLATLAKLEPKACTRAIAALVASGEAVKVPGRPPAYRKGS